MRKSIYYIRGLLKRISAHLLLAGLQDVTSGMIRGKNISILILSWLMLMRDISTHVLLQQLRIKWRSYVMFIPALPMKGELF
ncbi:hypothetical protein ES707_17679 [subsurface metagenome]